MQPQENIKRSISTVNYHDEFYKEGPVENKAARTKKKRWIPSEAIHCKRVIRRLQTDNVLTALMVYGKRELQVDLKIWDLGCEVYTAAQLMQFFDEQLRSGTYSLRRLASELMNSFDRLRDPVPDMDYPSIYAACNAVKREAKARMAQGDYQWAAPDPVMGYWRNPRDGHGWAKMTDALTDRMLIDRIPTAIDMRFASDLGL